MGSGLAVFAAAGAGPAVVALASELGYEASAAGVVESGPRQVVLEPIGVTYSSEELDLR